MSSMEFGMISLSHFSFLLLRGVDRTAPILRGSRIYSFKVNSPIIIRPASIFPCRERSLRMCNFPLVRVQKIHQQVLVLSLIFLGLHSLTCPIIGMLLLRLAPISRHPITAQNLAIPIYINGALLVTYRN